MYHFFVYFLLVKVILSLDSSIHRPLHLELSLSLKPLFHSTLDNCCIPSTSLDQLSSLYCRYWLHISRLAMKSLPGRSQICSINLSTVDLLLTELKLFRY